MTGWQPTWLTVVAGRGRGSLKERWAVPGRYRSHPRRLTLTTTTGEHRIQAVRSHARPITPWYDAFPVVWRVARLVRRFRSRGVGRPIHDESGPPTLVGVVSRHPNCRAPLWPQLPPDLDTIELASSWTMIGLPYYYTGNPVAEVEAPPSARDDDTRYDIPVLVGETLLQGPGPTLWTQFVREHPEFFVGPFAIEAN